MTRRDHPVDQLKSKSRCFPPEWDAPRKVGLNSKAAAAHEKQVSFQVAYPKATAASAACAKRWVWALSSRTEVMLTAVAPFRPPSKEGPFKGVSRVARSPLNNALPTYPSGIAISAQRPPCQIGKRVRATPATTSEKASTKANCS